MLDFLGYLFKWYWYKYEKYKTKNNFYDYDDMVDKPVHLLKTSPLLLKKVKELWQYILVDEYQDTNPAQDKLLHLIAPEGRNVFVVGDDYQCIYGFRGADVNNIISFPKHYPEARIIHLDTNYRSTPEIVNASNALIKINSHQFHKKAISGRKSISRKPSIMFYDDDKAEADGIARKIKRMHEAGHRYRDIAVLYRINSVSRQLEESLLLNDIPFSVQGGVKFFELKYVNDIINYLRLAVNPKNTDALMGVLNCPNRFLGHAYRSSAEEYMKLHNCSAWDAVCHNRLSKEWRYKKMLISC